MMLIGAAEPPRARRRGDFIRGALLQLLATALVKGFGVRRETGKE